ncbi:DUF3021 family protein [Weissella paramesenteroides]|uniref:DUF3021 family protein n=1 Tax=Weissella paramesenteroides TaxID=1249 RepID=UPI003F745FF7
MKLLLSGIMRGGIPFIILGSIAFMLSTQNKFQEAKGTFCMALILLFVGVTTVIYEIDQWSFAKQSLIHFLLMFITVYPVLLLSGWFPLNNLKDALLIFLYFAFVGLLIWSVLAVVFKIIQS